jgi:hypothetical protein
MLMLKKAGQLSTQVCGVLQSALVQEQAAILLQLQNLNHHFYNNLKEMPMSFYNFLKEMPMSMQQPTVQQDLASNLQKQAKLGIIQASDWGRTCALAYARRR